MQPHLTDYRIEQTKHWTGHLMLFHLQGRTHHLIFQGAPSPICERQAVTFAFPPSWAVLEPK